MPPDAHQIARVSGLIDDLLDKPMSKRLVDAFYDPETNFAGNTFLDLSPNKANEFGTADLLAVTMLGVNPGAVAARALLPPNGRLAADACSILVRIPTDIPLWDAEDTHLAAAADLWTLLQPVEKKIGVGATIAGKLLARKRPQLIPIVDKVIRDRLNCNRSTYWETFRGVLLDQDRRQRIEKLRPGQHTLRILDTLMWMHWSQSKDAKDARGEGDRLTPTRKSPRPKP